MTAILRSLTIGMVAVNSKNLQIEKMTEMTGFHRSRVESSVVAFQPLTFQTRGSLCRVCKCLGRQTFVSLRLLPSMDQPKKINKSMEIITKRTGTNNIL